MVSKIKALCKSRGLTMKALEDVAFPDTKGQVITRWDENRPSVDRVKRVADVLGVTVDELLKEDADEKP